MTREMIARRNDTQAGALSRAGRESLTERRGEAARRIALNADDLSAARDGGPRPGLLFLAGSA